MTSNTYHFAGKVVIVTGGGSGIGRSIARAFLDNEATVVVAGRHTEHLRETVAGYPHGFIHQTDVSKPDEARKLVDDVVREHGHLDVVVNNAGIFKGGEVANVDDETWHRLFAVNIDGLFYVVRAAMPHLVASQGNIVVVSSVSGIRGDWGQTVYNATKHAINGFVQCVALDYGNRGVRVNAIAPAFIKTDINKDVWTDPDRLKPYLVRVAMNRVGEPQDCAGAALFFASDDAAYITGTILPVDGGTAAATGQGRNSYD